MVSTTNTAQKMKFFINDFFRKCDQMGRKLRIWSHLLKKSLMEDVIFCAMQHTHFLQQTYLNQLLSNLRWGFNLSNENLFFKKKTKTEKKYLDLTICKSEKNLFLRESHLEKNHLDVVLRKTRFFSTVCFEAYAFL